MLNYKSTIVRDRPKYVGKKFLLMNSKKEKLFRTKEGFYIEVLIEKNGELVINKISESFKKYSVDFSLRKIGENYLGLKDPSVTQILTYLALPEMEVERIFNNLRYKYLKSIYLSGFDTPQKLINAEYNRALQSLAGLNVYQGGYKRKKK